jgi:hypothetical protein
MFEAVELMIRKSTIELTFDLVVDNNDLTSATDIGGRWSSESYPRSPGSQNESIEDEALCKPSQVDLQVTSSPLQSCLMIVGSSRLSLHRSGFDLHCSLRTADQEVLELYTALYS